jgi:hypothetical protein
VDHNILQYNPDPEAEDREGEIWMPVPGWLVEGNNTWVSNQGRVRNSNGLVFKPERSQDGYVRIRIRDTSLYMPRVQMAAFGVEPSSPCQTQVHHINQVRHDNRLENLEWITPPANVQDSWDNNPNRRTSAAKTSKPVRAKRVSAGGERAGEGVGEDEQWTTYPGGAHEAARVLGLHQSSISAACKEGGGVVGQRGQPDYKFYFEFAEPTEPDLLEGEEWKPWGPAFVSNKGRFRDCNGIVKTPSPSAGGYCRVTIDGKDRRINILAAELFLPPPLPGQTEVNHWNGDKSDNRAENLEWCTHSWNMLHSHRVLGHASNAAKRGKKVRCREVGSTGEWRVFESVNEAARALGITPRTVIRACEESAG